MQRFLYGCIVAHENVHFLMGITKEGAQSLRMKMRNAELYLKTGATVVYGLQPLAARLSELTSKLEILDCSHLFYSEPVASFQLITLRVSDDTKLRFTSLR